MKAPTSSTSRSRSEILGDIAAIPSAIQGKVCAMKKRLADGSVATYYNLQWWADGKSHSLHIPRDKVKGFQEATTGGERLRNLIAELSASDTHDILTADGSTLKKNSWTSPSKGRPDSTR